MTPNSTIQKGSLLFKDGKIIAAGSNIKLPENTVTHEKPRANIFILPSSNFTPTFGLAGKKGQRRRRSTQYTPDRQGYYWSDHILSDYSSLADYKYKKEEAASYRKAGFGVVNTHRPEGIHRGTGLLVALNDNQNDATRLIDEKPPSNYRLQKVVSRNQYYPGSIMGAMALLRQFFHDANWYAKGGAKNKDLAIEAFNRIKNLPAVFEANNKLDVARAVKIGQEFNLPFIVTANGREYEHLQASKRFGCTTPCSPSFSKSI